MLSVVETCIELDSVAVRIYRNIGSALKKDGAELWQELMSEKRHRVEQWRILKGGLEASLVPSPISNVESAKKRLRQSLERLVELEKMSAGKMTFKRAGQLAVQAEALLLDPDISRMLKISQIYGLSQELHSLTPPHFVKIADFSQQVGDTVVAFSKTLLKLYESYERAWDQEDRDPVTGAHARKVLFQHGRFLVDWARRYDRPLGMLIVRLDDFGSVVRQYGHSAADTLLGVAFNRINRVTRKTDWVVRHGVDEFVLLVMGTPSDGLSIVADKVLSMIRSPAIHVGDREIPITASIGLCNFPQEGFGEPSIELMLHLAGKALDKARDDGGNCQTTANAAMVPGT